MAEYNKTNITATYIRQIFNNSDDPDIVAAKDRLSKWAEANGYHIDTEANGYRLVTNTAPSSFIAEAPNNNIFIITIVTVSLISISAIGVVITIKKRKIDK